MQLLYPGFLWGLMGIGIPIIIHLLQLRKPQRVLFTNTGFIREIELTTIRRRRLQELLVLLMRVTAIVLLVLAFCQPVIPAAQQVSGATGGGVAVLVDDTPSMQAQGTKQNSLLQEAVIGARTLGNSYKADGRFRLVNQATGLLNETAYNAMLATLQNARGKLNWVEADKSKLLASEAQQPLYLFSDFQRDKGAARFFRNIPVGKEVILVPQIARQTANIYVDSVWVEDAFVRVGTNISLHIRLRNGGDEPIADCPVKVLLDKRQVAAFRTTVAAGQTTTTLVQVQLPTTKLALGQVVTADAPVIFDNTYYFSLQPARTIQILEVGMQPVARQVYENELLFKYSFAKPQEVDYSKLHQANLVLLDEIAQVDASLQAALIQVVQRGGSVVIVPSAKPSARSSYGQLFRALGIGPAQWNTTAQPDKEELAMPNKRSPFFKDVFGVQARQVAMPQAALVLNLGRNGTDILRLRDGDSYLTEFESGKGKAYVFAAPFDKAYSDFTTHALLVPVLYRMAMLSYHTDQPLAYRLTAATVAVASPNESLTPSVIASKAQVRLVRDSATFIPRQRAQGPEIQLSIPTEMTQPGFYQVRQGGKLLTTLAFNADRHESELAAYSAAELRALIGPNQPNVRVLENGAQPEAIARYRAGQVGQPLWRYCLLLALACLLVEGLLLRFGRPKVATQQAVAT